MTLPPHLCNTVLQSEGRESVKVLQKLKMLHDRRCYTLRRWLKPTG